MAVMQRLAIALLLSFVLAAAVACAAKTPPPQATLDVGTILTGTADTGNNIARWQGEHAATERRKSAACMLTNLTPSVPFVRRTLRSTSCGQAALRTTPTNRQSDAELGSRPVEEDAPSTWRGWQTPR